MPKEYAPQLFSTGAFTFKNCFGSVAGYIDGKIFVSCGNFGLALKLPENTLQDLFKNQGAKPLQYFPKGHIKKDYAVIPEVIVGNREFRNKLIGQSIKFAESEGLEYQNPASTETFE